MYCTDKLITNNFDYQLKRYLLALDDESRLICYDRSFLLPLYVNESVGQYVLFEVEGSPKRTLVLDHSDTSNHSLLMRSFMGNFVISCTYF